jgi:hypothetical protein
MKNENPAITTIEPIFVMSISPVAAQWRCAVFMLVMVERMRYSKLTGRIRSSECRSPRATCPWPTEGQR